MSDTSADLLRQVRHECRVNGYWHLSMSDQVDKHLDMLEEESGGPMSDICDHCDGKGKLRNNRGMPEYRFGHITCPTCLGNGKRRIIAKGSNPRVDLAGASPAQVQRVVGRQSEDV